MTAIQRFDRKEVYVKLSRPRALFIFKMAAGKPQTRLTKYYKNRRLSLVSFAMLVVDGFELKIIINPCALFTQTGIIEVK